MTDDLKDRLRHIELFQVCDSTFPIGTFNHSFGMENYLSTREITSGKEFKIWLRSYFHTQFKYGEGLLIHLIYQTLEDSLDKMDRILQYDAVIMCSTLATETRNGTKLIAQQMLNLLKELYGSAIPFIEDYQRAIKRGDAWGNPAIVFTLFAHYIGVDCLDAFIMYGYSISSTMVQNAARSVPLGQKEGQLILKATIDEMGVLYSKVKALDITYLGANAPGIELAQIKHETQESRLFMS